MTPRKPPASIPLIIALIDERLEGAACTGRAPMFDDTIAGETSADRLERLGAARRICRSCPVQGLCHTAAHEHQSVGVWAGLLRGQAEQDTTREQVS